MRLILSLFLVTPQGQTVSLPLNGLHMGPRHEAVSVCGKRPGCVDDSGMGPSLCPRLKGCRIDDSGMGPKPRVRVHPPLAPLMLDRR